MIEGQRRLKECTLDSALVSAAKGGRAVFLLFIHKIVLKDMI